MISVAVQDQLQHSKRRVAPFFRRRHRRTKSTLIFSACAYNEFAYPTRKIGDTLGILPGKTLVIVIVSIEDNICMGGVEIVPEGLHLRRVAMLITGTKQWDVPESRDAVRRTFLEIRAQPKLFR